MKREIRKLLDTALADVIDRDRAREQERMARLRQHKENVRRGLARKNERSLYART
jgi:hypothetical protein